MIVIKIILWTLLGLLILIAIALAIPARLFVHFTDEIFLQVRYLFLKITIPITEEQKAQQKKKPKKEKKKKDAVKQEDKKAEKSDGKNDKKKDKKDKKKKKPNPVVKWLKNLYDKGGVEALLEAFSKIAGLVGNVLKPIFTHIKLKGLNIDITVASEDAAQTAITYGRLCAGVYPALAVILGVVKYDDYNVMIRPDFDKTEFEFDISMEISLVPWFAVGGALHALVRFIGFKIKGVL